MPRALYIASTPLIALEAAAAALARGGPARLLLLQDFDLAERLAMLLRGWRDNPFDAVELLPGRHTEYRHGALDHPRGLARALHRTKVKRVLRRRTLAAIRALDADLRPAEVWVGNDRKVETQLALYLAGRRAGRPVGHYLDDGLYTYLGDVRVRPLVRRIDWLVKRLAYGRFWQRADLAGSTPYIARAWLAFPQLARDADPRRERVQLPRAWFTGRPFLRLALRAAAEFGLDRRALAGAAAVLVLPHSNQLRAQPGLLEALRGTIAGLAGRGPVAVKYHPRELEADPGGLLGGARTVALPALLPIELLLPFLPPGAMLLGEGSTALLAAHWLRPDLAVRDLGLSSHPYACRARELAAALGIPGIAAADARSAYP